MDVEVVGTERLRFGDGSPVRAASANGTTEDLWMRFCIRSLIGVSGVLVVLGAMEYSSARPASLMNPGVENTVAQLLGVL